MKKSETLPHIPFQLHSKRQIQNDFGYRAYESLIYSEIIPLTNNY